MNPWGISDLEAEVLDALCELGDLQRVADALLITKLCAQSRLRAARCKMAGERTYRHRGGYEAVPTIVACLRWNEWSKAASEAEELSTPYQTKTNATTARGTAVKHA